MRIYLTAFSLILQISAGNLQAQDPVTVAAKPPEINLRLAGTASLIYPGARIGAEFTRKSFEVGKSRAKGNSSPVTANRLVAINLSWYHHPGFHDNFYLTAGPVWRRVWPKGFFFEFTPEAGFSRTFLGGTTYTVNSKGVVTVEKLAGYNYLLVSFGVGGGYDFSRRGKLPALIDLRLNMLRMLPYNSAIYIRPLAEAGFIWKLQHEK